jgi:hypothetical protein
MVALDFVPFCTAAHESIAPASTFVTSATVGFTAATQSGCFTHQGPPAGWCLFADLISQTLDVLQQLPCALRAFHMALRELHQSAFRQWRGLKHRFIDQP